MEREGLVKDDSHLEVGSLDAEEDSKVVVEEDDGRVLVHENSSTNVRVYRMNVRGRTVAVSDGQTRCVAVKVLGGERPDPESLKRLYDEFILSRLPILSRCSAVRAALQHAKHNGSHAICLEWVEGVTLREWVRSNFSISSGGDSLRNAVSLGCVIAGAIAEMHSVGVVHNNISLDNIIVCAPSTGKCTSGVNGGKENGEHFSIKLIGLGSAVLLKENNPNSLRRAKQKDLCSLGATLYEIFSGESRYLHRNVGKEIPKIKFAVDEAIISSLPSSQEFEERLWSNGIPQCLAMLVSKLLKPGEERTVDYSFQSAVEVLHDLKHIRDNPDRFLFSDDSAGLATVGRLEFPSGRLYGRSAEVSAISYAFDRVVRADGRSEMTLIWGASGTGKTALVSHVQQALVQRGGIFLKGKFDLLGKVEGLSAIASAFEGYCESLLAQDNDDLYRMRTALLDVVGADGISVLIDFVPSLQSVMGRDYVAASKIVVSGKEAQHRLTQMFRLFARAISSKSRPLVLFLDDLQWAGSSSLELMKSIIVDNDNKMLLIGSFRDNEVDSSNALPLRLDEIEAFGVPITRIKLQNITDDAINHLISETLRVPLSVSNLLSCIVHRRTFGNFFFAKQYLTSLFDAGLVRYSTLHKSWQWDLQLIESVQIADSALGLATQNIAKLPAKTRRAVEVAACLGCHCDLDILRLIEDRDIGGDDMETTSPCEYLSRHRDHGLADALDVAIDRRLMEKEGSRYFFVHDQICQAALSMMPETAQAEMHHHIGMCIWKKSPQPKLEEYLFVAVDHLSLGSSLFEENYKLSLAQLYLRAGQKAISLSLFMRASTYLKAGIDLLGSSPWTRHYDLSLQLFKLYADMQYCNGGEIGYFVDQILDNAKCFDDKLGAYYTLANALGARGNLVDAVESSFLVLQELGESFPARGSFDLESYALDEWEETRGMLDEFTDETLTTMRDMTDERKIWAMKFLNLLTLQTYLAEPDYFPLASMRMVQITLSYGFCTESAVGFAWYGLIQCSQFGDFKRGYQFGQVALRLLERSDSKDRLCRVYAIVYARINHWTKPLRLSLEPLLRSHHMGLRSGDVEFSMVNVADYCLHGLQSGVQLASLEHSLRSICPEMREFKQDVIYGASLVTWQFVLNLMGHSADPLRLTGDAMEQESLEKHWMEINLHPCLCRLFFFRMWLAYLYGEYTLAVEMAERSRSMAIMNPAEVAVSNHAFLDGMASLALARKTKEKKWRIAAKKALKKLESWSIYAPCNFRHKVEMLEAEFAFLEEDWGKARRAYDAGISLAGDNGFVQDQALASERAALFHLACGDQEKASEFFDKAYLLYMEWGALGKAEHVKSCMISIIEDNLS